MVGGQIQFVNVKGQSKPSKSDLFGNINENGNITKKCFDVKKNKEHYKEV